MSNFFSISLLLVISLTMYGWIFRPDSYFYVDDWGWLNRAVFTPWSHYLSWETVLPAALFMDRPIAGMAIQGLYEIFGLNHLGFSVAALTIHFTNTILIYFIGKKVIGSKVDGLIAAMLFAANSYISYPVWWIATVHDSLSLLFCLSSFLAFISKKRFGIYLACLFYYLATRSKEASLPFPLILIAYELILGGTHLETLGSTAKYKKSLQKLRPLIAIFIFLGTFYAYYYLRDKLTGQNFGPYAPKFTINTIFEGINFYVKLILFNTLDSYKAILTCLSLAAASLAIRDLKSIFFFIAFLVAASPVLVLGAQRVPYYAYIPAPWLYLFLSSCYASLFCKFFSRSCKTPLFLINLSVISLTIGFCIFVFKSENISKPTLNSMRENKKAQSSLLSGLNEVREGTNFVILGVPSGPITFFAYAPCHAIKVLYKVKEITCYIQESDVMLRNKFATLELPKILLEYNQGEIKILENRLNNQRTLPGGKL